MKISEIATLLNAEVLCGADKLGGEVRSACGSDMMSDVLAFVKDQAVLITGLLNPQVIRTAMMMDMQCVVFARGKQPTPDILQLAENCKLTVLSTRESMYTACGKLYDAGLRGGDLIE
jgi:predicted transcriptional regulator